MFREKKNINTGDFSFVSSLFFFILLLNMFSYETDYVTTTTKHQRVNHSQK